MIKTMRGGGDSRRSEGIVEVKNKGEERITKINEVEVEEVVIGRTERRDSNG